MFRCQFSGEVSDGPVFDYVVIVDPSTERQRKVLSKVKESEKPIRIAVSFRPQTYNNFYKDSENKTEKFVTNGKEIVKELLVRARHLDAVKKKYGLV